MPYELAAAFVRGAVLSSAAEPWKAAVRFSSHRRHFSFSPSASPPDAAHYRRNITVSMYKPEHASGRGRSSFPTADPRYRRFLTGAPSSAEKPWRQEGGAYLYHGSDCSLYPVTSRRSLWCRALTGTTTELGTQKELPQLGRVVKIALLCLVLQKMGLLAPKDTVDKDKAKLNLALLCLALHAGFTVSRDKNKLASLLKICDVAMKLYKVSSEIVSLLFTLFK